MIRRVYEYEVKRRRNRGRLCTKLQDRIKKACKTRLIELSDATVMRVDGE